MSSPSFARALRKLRHLTNRLAKSAWFAYTAIVLLQLKIIWGMWHYRDLTFGDTSYYFVTAYDWFTNRRTVIAWSPLYTSFYGSMLYLSSDAYVATYEPRDPSQTVLYKVVADHLETFLAALDADPDAKGLPAYVQREFYDYLQCGILAHGFLRLGCDTCQKELLLPFSCKRRGFCPSCAGRRTAQTAARLVECVSPATVSAEGAQLNGRPSPGCRHGNGWCPCRCPYAIGCPHHTH